MNAAGPIVIRRTVAILFLSALTSLSAWAGPPPAPPALTAAFVYTLVKFTEWPATSPLGDVTMCIVGDPVVAEALGKIVAGRQVTGRSVAVVLVQPGRPLRPCHLLFVAGTDAAHTARALDEVAGTPVLTVGEGEWFVRQGGIAGLYMDHEKMRFAINPDAALRAGVHLSSKILSLARIVKDEAHDHP